MQLAVLAKTDRGQAEHIRAGECGGRLLRHERQGLVDIKVDAHFGRHVFQPGFGEHFLRELHFDGLAVPRLEAAELQRNHRSVRDVVAGLVYFDQSCVGLLIVRDDFVPCRCFVGISEHTFDACKDRHIRAQPVAGLVLHLDPDAHHAAARQRRHRPHRDAVFLNGHAGDGLALLGKAAEHVLQRFPQRRTGGSERRKGEQNNEHSRQHGAPCGPAQPVGPALRAAQDSRPPLGRQGDLLHCHVKIPPHIASIHRNTILSGIRAAYFSRGTGARSLWRR